MKFRQYHLTVWLVVFQWVAVGPRWVSVGPRWVRRWVPVGLRWVPVALAVGPAVGPQWVPGGSQWVQRWVPVCPLVGPSGSAPQRDVFGDQ